MRWNRPFLVAVVALLGWVGSAQADFVQIVSFGDSLSDVGNLYTASGNTQPPPPYYNGHFSNGPIWVESLAAKLGVPMPTPGVLGGTDYAWASAESGTGVSPSHGVPNLLTQVGSFALKNTVSAKALVTIWAGGNDFFDGQTNPLIPAQNIATAITQLAKVGGKNFMVPELPMLDAVPYAQSLTAQQKAGLHALSLGFNAALQAEVGPLEKSLGVNIYLVDTPSLFAKIQANPGLYGFTNVTTSALDDKVISGQGYLFWDGIHPTTAGHALIADAALAQVAPEPSTLLMLATAAAGVTAWRARRNLQRKN
jgi:phospholipase/lecithinase/hemolysin